MKLLIYISLLAILLATAAIVPFCSNNPWRQELSDSNTLFLPYASQIRYLDQSASYYVHESAILDNIVEAPLSYHYLKRPYQLQPLLLTEIPTPEYFDAAGKPLSNTAPAHMVAAAKYTLRIRPDIAYQPHDCFPQIRYLAARDFHTALVRLADPTVSSPIYSNVCSFLPGLQDASRQITEARNAMEDARRANGESMADIHKYPSLPNYHDIKIPGVEIVDDLTITITLSRKYPQFAYWLAMHFFAPLPYEALVWYNRPEAIDAGLDFRNHPIGTGAYMLTEMEPNDHIVLERNPNFHPDFYPEDASEEDAAKGLLEDSGKRLPFIHRIYFKYEAEAIPSWIKFQQGYYDINGDNSGLPMDLMDAAITLNPQTGAPELTKKMAGKNLQMDTSVMLTSYYFAFNWLDPVIGGPDESHRLIRQAIAMVLDINEYIDVFKNGNGRLAENILPPGIFGYLPTEQSLNSEIHVWNPDLKRAENKSLEEARKLMIRAGYPGGIGPDGKPLTIHLDHASAGAPGFKARFAWLAEKMSKLGIVLKERQADLNRHRSKIESGSWQMQFERGWVADYPDAENFLMLFKSENGIVRSQGRGSNNFNYENPEFDRLFQELETCENSPERQALISSANAVICHDMPVIFTMFPVNTILTHQWIKNYKPNVISYDKLKYLRLDDALRTQMQKTWNH